MADRAGFPQIPRPVWSGVRSIFNKSLSRKLDENGLAASLNVQPVAARQYLAELRRVGLLTEDGGPTALAAKWRQDDKYQEAIEEILRTAYPASLIEVAPAGSADRSVVERWFKNHGLGEGTARNKAATYLMIANGSAAGDEPTQTGDVSRKSRQRSAPENNNSVSKRRQEGSKGSPEEGNLPPSGSIPLNVNVQIHISADASSDQIEAIFSSMRKYLYGSSAA